MLFPFLIFSLFSLIYSDKVFGPSIQRSEWQLAAQAGFIQPKAFAKIPNSTLVIGFDTDTIAPGTSGLNYPVGVVNTGWVNFNFETQKVISIFQHQNASTSTLMQKILWVGDAEPLFFVLHTVNSQTGVSKNPLAGPFSFDNWCETTWIFRDAIWDGSGGVYVGVEIQDTLVLPRFGIASFDLATTYLDPNILIILENVPTTFGEHLTRLHYDSPNLYAIGYADNCNTGCSSGDYPIWAIANGLLTNDFGIGANQQDPAIATYALDMAIDQTRYTFMCGYYTTVSTSKSHAIIMKYSPGPVADTNTLFLMEKRFDTIVPGPSSEKSLYDSITQCDFVTVDHPQMVDSDGNNQTTYLAFAGSTYGNFPERDSSSKQNFGFEFYFVGLMNPETMEIVSLHQTNRFYSSKLVGMDYFPQLAKWDSALNVATFPISLIIQDTSSHSNGWIAESQFITEVIRLDIPFGNITSTLGNSTDAANADVLNTFKPLGAKYYQKHSMDFGRESVKYDWTRTLTMSPNEKYFTTSSSVRGKIVETLNNFELTNVDRLSTAASVYSHDILTHSTHFQYQIQFGSEQDDMESTSVVDNDGNLYVASYLAPGYRYNCATDKIDQLTDLTVGEIPPSLLVFLKFTPSSPKPVWCNSFYNSSTNFTYAVKGKFSQGLYVAERDSVYFGLTIKTDYGVFPYSTAKTKDWGILEFDAQTGVIKSKYRGFAEGSSALLSMFYVPSVDMIIAAGQNLNNLFGSGPGDKIVMIAFNSDLVARKLFNGFGTFTGNIGPIRAHPLITRGFSFPIAYDGTINLPVGSVVCSKPVCVAMASFSLLATGTNFVYEDLETVNGFLYNRLYSLPIVAGYHYDGSFSIYSTSSVSSSFPSNGSHFQYLNTVNEKFGAPTIVSNINGIPTFNTLNRPSSSYLSTGYTFPDGSAIFILENNFEKEMDPMLHYVGGVLIDNQRPIITDSLKIYLDEDQTYEHQVLASDADNFPANISLQLFVTDDSNMKNVSYTQTGNQLFFSPDENYFGTQSIEYVMFDGVNPSLKHTLEIVYRPVDDTFDPTNPDSPVQCESRAPCKIKFSFSGFDDRVNGGSSSSSQTKKDSGSSLPTIEFSKKPQLGTVKLEELDFTESTGVFSYFSTQSGLYDSFEWKFVSPDGGESESVKQVINLSPSSAETTLLSVFGVSALGFLAVGCFFGRMNSWKKKYRPINVVVSGGTSYGATSMATSSTMAKDADSKYKIQICSLDGGGIRGLSIIYILEAIERALKEPISDHYHLMAGTSTGGILAFGLSYRFPLTQAKDLYSSLGTKVFGKTPRGSKSKMIRQLTGRSFYKGEKFSSILRDIFSEQLLYPEAANGPRRGKMQFPVALAVSTITSLNTPSEFLFRNYDFELPDSGESVYQGTDLNSDNDWKVWEAVRATTAAPLFFSEYTDGERRFADGALFHNNPTRVAVNEARTVWPGCAITNLLSIGTGLVIDKTSNKKNSSSVFGWLQMIAEIAVNSERTHRDISSEFPSGIYYRFNTPLVRPLSLDDASSNSLFELETLSRGFTASPMILDRIDSLVECLKENKPHLFPLTSGTMNDRAPSMLNALDAAASLEPPPPPPTNEPFQDFSLPPPPTVETHSIPVMPNELELGTVPT